MCTCAREKSCKSNMDSIRKRGELESFYSDLVVRRSANELLRYCFERGELI